MKYIFISSAVIIIVFLILNFQKTDAKKTPAQNGFAVIELFTSQGCSSCPPADALLGKYVHQKDPHLICLSFHVDYWNRLGWKDVFSNSSFSQRQRMYDENLHSETFTPQTVINGTTQFVGSDERNISQAISRNISSTPSAQIQSQQSVQGNDVSIGYTLSGNYNQCDLAALLVQNKAATKIGAGENDGRMLDEYNVVRDFKIQTVSSQKGNIHLTIPPDIKAHDCSVVLFLQKQNQKEIEIAEINAL